MTVLVLAVGLGPPLQTMSLDVTSVMGCGTVNNCFVLAWERRNGGILTPSYEGTRTPSPTAPPFSETKMVCAVADEAAAAIARDVESFILTGWEFVNCLRA